MTRPQHSHDGGTDHDPSDTELSIQAPARSRMDEQIEIRVTGVLPETDLTVEAMLVDADDNEWRSAATFTATSDGVVDLTSHAPHSGTYEGTEPMGWLWSMQTTTEAWLPAVARGPTATVDIEVRNEGETATTTLVRQVYDPDIRSRSIDRDDLVGTLYLPSGDGPHPPVVDLHGSSGRLGEGTARMLASKGFAVLALTYFGEPDPLPDDLCRIPLTYFDDAADWLLAQPEIAGDQVGLWGVSRGGELGLLLGARYDWGGAVVAYAPSGLVWDTPLDEPAWIHEGEPVPHVTAEDNPWTRFEAGIDDATIEHAMPAVETIDGPILLVSGGEDRIWPARALSELVIDRLDEAEFPYAYEHLTYDGVDHLLSPPYIPTTGAKAEDGTAKQLAHASEEYWPKTQEFLRRGLATTDGGWHHDGESTHPTCRITAIDI